MPSVSEAPAATPLEPARPVSPVGDQVKDELPRRWIRAIVALVVVGVVALAAWRMLPPLFSTPASPTVRASGRIEGREVSVAPKDLQGRVTRLLADEGET